jgi:hypothetical protein
VIRGNTIAGNSAGMGGGVYSSYGGATLTNNVIVGNTSTDVGGGAGFNSLQNPSVTNNIVAGNTARVAGGSLYFSDGTTATVVNDTVTGNSDGIVAFANATTIKNCIIWHNGVADLRNCSATYSDVSVGGSGLDNINADPLFQAPLSGDYRLAAGSPCADTATSTGAPVSDIGGVTRPWAPAGTWAPASTSSRRSTRPRLCPALPRRRSRSRFRSRGTSCRRRHRPTRRRARSPS